MPDWEQVFDPAGPLLGIQDVGEVERAYLEPNGMISVVRRGGGQTEPVERPEAL